MSIIPENALDEELDKEPKYDYHNKDTDSNRNSHSLKPIHIVYDDMEEIYTVIFMYNIHYLV